MELKFFDTGLATGTLAAPTDMTGGEHNPSGTVNLSAVAQGDGPSDRDGKQIIMKSIHVQGVIQIPSQASTTSLDVMPTCYVAIVMDKQTNGGIVVSEQIFKQTQATSATAGSPFRNLLFSKRYWVVKSTQIEMGQPAAAGNGTNASIGGFQTPFNLHADLRNTVANFSAVEGTIANEVDSGLNLIAFCSTVGSAPVIIYGSRLRFVG